MYPTSSAFFMEINRNLTGLKAIEYNRKSSEDEPRPQDQPFARDELRPAAGEDVALILQGQRDLVGVEHQTTGCPGRAASS